MDALEIRVLAEIGQLKAEMAKAEGVVGDSMKKMSDMAGMVQKAFGLMLGVASVNAFAGFVNSTIDATGKMKDLSTQTGMSEAALGAFKGVAALSETSITSVTSATNKLSRELVQNSEDGKKAGSALKAMGLDFNEFKNMRPEDQMLAVGKAMNNFADGSEKSTAATLLFGKAGAELLPFLKDLGEESGNISKKLTEQEVELRKNQAAMADAYGDNLTAINKNMNSWKKDISMALLPALFELSEAYKLVEKGGGGVKGSISELSKDGSITTWARTAVTGVTYVLDVFSGVTVAIQSAGIAIGGVMASVGEKISSIATAAKQAASGDFKGAFETMEASERKQKAITDEMKSSLDQTWGAETLGSKLRARIADIQATGLASEEIKPKMDLSGVLEKNDKASKEAERAAKALAAELKKQDDAYKSLTTSIASKITELNAELNGTEKLTAAEKEQITFLEGLRTGKISLSDAQKQAIITQQNELIELEKLTAEHKNNEKQMAENRKENDNLRDSIFKSTEKTRDAIKAEKDAQNAYGLSKDEIALLEVAKTRDAAAQATRNAANMAEVDANLAQEYRDQASELTKLAELKENGIHVKAAKDAELAWKATTDSIRTGLSASLADAIVSGKDLWITFRDYMKTAIIDGVLKNAIAKTINDGISGTGSSITSMVGNFGAGLGGMFDGLGTKLGGMFGGLNNGLSGMFDGLGTKLSSIFGGLFDSLSGLLSSLWGGLSSMLGAVGATKGTSGDLGSLGSMAGKAADWLGIGGGAAATGAAASTTAGITAGGGILGAGADFGMGTYGATAAAEAAGTGAAAEAGLFGSVGASSALLTGIGVLAAPIIIGSLLSGTRSVWNDAGAAAPVGSYSTADKMDFSGENEKLIAGKSGIGLYAQKQIEPETGNVRYLIVDEKGSQIADAGATLDQSDFSAIPNFIPKFANGGDHSGGLRIVGERGKEMEATGAARIFTAEQTQAILNGDSPNGAAMARVELLLEMLIKHAETTAAAVSGTRQRSPILVQQVTTT